MSKELNCYQILKVSPDSSAEDIKKSFRKLVLENHPEKNNFSKESREKFWEIQESFKELCEKKEGNDNNKISSFFPPDRNKLIKLKHLTNKLNDLDAEDEERKIKNSNLLRITNEELDKLKAKFLEIYKNGPHNTKYSYLDLTLMFLRLESIKEREQNKELDITFQGYKSELEDNCWRPLDPLEPKLHTWFCQASNLEERIAESKKISDDILPGVQNTLEEIEKIRYLTPVEANELKRIKEFNEDDLVPIDLSKYNEEEEVDIQKLSKQDLIDLIEKSKQEIQELKTTRNKNSNQWAILATKEQKLSELEKRVKEVDAGQENSPKLSSNQWKGNLKALGIIGLVIIAIILVTIFIRSRAKKIN